MDSLSPGSIQCQADISKFASKLWKTMTTKDREPFVQEAMMEKQAHLINHPNYVFKPSRPSKKRQGNQTQPKDKAIPDTTDWVAEIFSRFVGAQIPTPSSSTSTVQPSPIATSAPPIESQIPLNLGPVEHDTTVHPPRFEHNTNPSTACVQLPPIMEPPITVVEPGDVFGQLSSEFPFLSEQDTFGQLLTSHSHIPVFHQHGSTGSIPTAQPFVQPSIPVGDELGSSLFPVNYDDLEFLFPSKHDTSHLFHHQSAGSIHPMDYDDLEFLFPSEHDTSHLFHHQSAGSIHPTPSIVAAQAPPIESIESPIPVDLARKFSFHNIYPSPFTNPDTNIIQEIIDNWFADTNFDEFSTVDSLSPF